MNTLFFGSYHFAFFFPSFRFLFLDFLSFQRSFAMDQLRSEVRSWTLASDKRLLTYLQSMSDNILAKTSALQNDLERLNYESKSTETRMNNSFNELLMLASSQFVENVRIAAVIHYFSIVV